VVISGSHFRELSVIVGFLEKKKRDEVLRLIRCLRRFNQKEGSRKKEREKNRRENLERKRRKEKEEKILCLV
jgi:hypothetical protein